MLQIQIPDKLQTKLEGFVPEPELREALFEDMKPKSAPGIDGFTVKFLRTLAPLITKAINHMKKRGSYPYHLDQPS